MSNHTPQRHGSRYWCIGLTDKEATEVYVFAHRIEVRPDGALIAIGRFNRGSLTDPEWDDDDHLNLAFASGAWRWFYAASVMDGAAIAVEHWSGQINE